MSRLSKKIAEELRPILKGVEPLKLEIDTKAYEQEYYLDMGDGDSYTPCRMARCNGHVHESLNAEGEPQGYYACDRCGLVQQ